MALVFVSLLSGAPVYAQQSPSFLMQRVTLAVTGAVAASTSFSTRVTFGQTVPVGAASRCHDGYHQTAGFWSILGDQPVPATLVVAKDPGNLGGVILSWSGSASQYDVYRSSLATSVLDPGNFVSSSFDCTKPDLPPVTPSTYYLVAPAAEPGRGHP